MSFYYLFFKEYMIFAGMFPYVLFFLPIILLLVIFLPQLINRLTLPKDILLFLIFGIIYLLIDILTRDFDGILEQIKFFVGIVAIYTLAKIAPMNVNYLKRYGCIFLLINLIYSVLVPSSTISFFTDNSKLYFGAAHHWIKIIIYLLILYIWSLHLSISKTNYSMVFFGFSMFLVFAFLSGSRGGLVVVLFVVFILLCKLKYEFKLKYIFIFFIFLSSIYILPLFLNGIVLDNIAGDYLKMDEGRDDISSGRTWLQLYHLTLFNEYFYTGAPKELLEFKVGDLVDGEIAHAASESMFTFYLAREGIWGALKLLILLYIFVLRPYISNNFIGFVAGSSILLLSSTLSILNNVYSFPYIYFVWLYFSIELHFKRVSRTKIGAV